MNCRVLHSLERFCDSQQLVTFTLTSICNSNTGMTSTCMVTSQHYNINSYHDSACIVVFMAKAGEIAEVVLSRNSVYR